MDKPILQTKTALLGLIPLGVSLIIQVLELLGIIPANSGLADSIARILEVFGIGGIGYGVRSAVGRALLLPK